MRVFNVLFLLLFFLLFGCAGQQHVKVTDASGVVYPLPLPAVYSADLPCQDCSNRTVFLSLHPDGHYLLHVSTIKKEAMEDDVKAEFGIWKYESKENAIQLISYGKKRKSFVITSPQTIKLLSESGGLVVGENRELKQSTERNDFTDTVPLQGMYRLDGDGATLTECLTGKTFPLDREAQYQSLEQGYKNTPHAQDEPLLVRLQGRFVSSLAGEGQAVLPVRFNEISPGLGCDGIKKDTLSLTESNWSLQEIMGKPVTLRKGQNRPYIALMKKGRRVKGFGGCNHFSGTYFMLGDVFLFNKRVGTRMACVDCMDLEFNFFKVLSATDGYHIEGNILEFRDRDRNVLARFEYTGKI